MSIRLLRLATVCGLVASLFVLAPFISAAGADPVHASPVVDAQSAPDEDTAQTIAQKFDHGVTVDGATTETQLVQAEPDGSFTSVQDELPVRVKQGDSWIPTDSTLAASGGFLHPAAASVPVQFSTGGSSQLAKVQAADGTWISESWPVGALPSPQVSGSSATYSNVYPGVDLQLTATSTGMAQVLVVKDAKAAANPALANIAIGINNGSLSTTQQPSGPAAMKDSGGTTQLSTSSATWWDSSAPDSSAAGPGGLSVPVPLPVTVNDSQMTIDAASALQKPGLTYPVYVDPSLIGYNVGWTYTDLTYPNQSYWQDTNGADTAQHMGYIANSPDDHRAHTARSYWQMDSSQWVGTSIQSASMQVTNVYSYSCVAKQADLYSLDVSISAATTWLNQPGTPATPIATKSFAYGGGSACPASTNNVAFDATDAVQAAATKGSHSIAFELKAHDETDSYGWKKFSGQARLLTTFWTIPQVQSLSVVRNCWAVCGANPVDSSTLPTYSAGVKQTDRSDVQLTWQVCIGTPGNTGGCQVTTSTGSYVANGPTTVTMQAIEDSTKPLWTAPWVVKVTPCRVTPATVCGLTTNWASFSVDTISPATPDAVSSDVDFSGTTVKGLAWHQYNMSLSGGADANSGTWGYVYTFVAGSSAPVLSNTTNKNETCPRPSGSNYYVVCANAGSVPFTAGPGTNTVSVWAIDKAGNESATPVIKHFVVGTPTGAAHGWAFSPDSWLNNVASVADGVGTGNDKYDLSLHGTSWFTVGQDYSGNPLNDPNADPNMPAGHFSALSFGANTTPATAYAATTAMQNGEPPLRVDGTSSGGLTAAAWVKATPTTVGQVFLSQDDGTAPSVFTLGENATGHWQFCMRTTTTGTGLPDCASTTSLADTDGRWTYVVGSWNPDLQTMYVDAYRYGLGSDNDPDLGIIGAQPLDASTANQTSNPQPCEVATGIAHGATSGSTDRIVIGRGFANGAGASWWTSAVSDPAVWNSYEDPTHRSSPWGGSCS